MKDTHTIENVVKFGLCTGCGTCAGVCPVNAIRMEIHPQKGIYLPYIDREKCTECGLCVIVCPGHEVDFNFLNEEIFGKQPDNSLLGNYIQCYTGYSTDHEIRYNCSSGGMVTALLIHALKTGLIDGALVTKMNPERPLEPLPFIARKKEEIFEAARSKYCPVPVNLAVSEILNLKGKYAVVGLPCHIHGIRKAEQNNNILKERISLHIGIFCANNVSFHGTEQMLKKLRIKKTEVEMLSYRGDGWPGYLKLKLQNKISEYKIKYSTYSDNFFQAFTPWRCKLCIDHTSELADISCGDAWLREITNVDETGTTMIISRTQRGEDILKHNLSNKQIQIVPIEIKDVIRSQNGFQGKKLDVIARFRLTRFVGKKIPIYNTVFFNHSYHFYFSAINDFTKYLLANNPKTLWILKLYCYILQKVNLILKIIFQ